MNTRPDLEEIFADKELKKASPAQQLANDGVIISGLP
jgi:hypothetical protein